MIDWTDLPKGVNADPEFQLAARFWDATLRLDFGSGSRALRFENGALTDVSRCAADSACDVFVTASDEAWRELLKPTPRPFYQDLYGAQLHHDVRLPNDAVTFAAYYPALRRLMQLMSKHRGDAR